MHKLLFLSTLALDKWSHLGPPDSIARNANHFFKHRNAAETCDPMKPRCARTVTVAVAACIPSTLRGLAHRFRQRRHWPSPQFWRCQSHEYLRRRQDPIGPRRHRGSLASPLGRAREKERELTGRGRHRTAGVPSALLAAAARRALTRRTPAERQRVQSM